MRSDALFVGTIGAILIIASIALVFLACQGFFSEAHGGFAAVIAACVFLGVGTTMVLKTQG